MTLKQRLAELLPHFDDDGKLLPNKKMTVKQNPLGGFRASTLCDFEHVVANVISGNEYRIEDLPKRPREVWLSCRPDSIGGNVYSDEDEAKENMDCGRKPIRFIEDVPREVTHEDGVRALAFYADKVGRGGRVEAMQATLQHYENERGK